MSTDIKQPVATIDLTPTWEGVLSTLLLLYTEGNHQARSEALKELQRMAKIADMLVQERK